MAAVCMQRSLKHGRLLSLRITSVHRIKELLAGAAATGVRIEQTRGTHFKLKLANVTKYQKVKRKSWHVRKTVRPFEVPEDLTPENEQFVKELVSKTYNKSGELNEQPSPSPLRDAPWEKGQWKEGSLRCRMLGIKLGSLPMWLKSGKKVMTTLIWLKDNHVINYRPYEEWAVTPAFTVTRKAQHARWQRGIWDHYWRQYCTGRFRWYSGDKKLARIVVGSDDQDPRKFTPGYLGLFHRAGVMPKRRIVSFYITENAKIQPGTPLTVNHFKVGDYVSCTARSICHGFQNVVKRWAQKGGPNRATATKFYNRPGSIAPGGASWRKGPWPGKHMPGIMGGYTRNSGAVKILRINPEYNVLYVLGKVPGGVNSWVKIRDTELSKYEEKRHRQDPHYAFPTYYPESSEVSPEELFAEDVQKFDDETIIFKEAEKKKKITVRNR